MQRTPRQQPAPTVGFGDSVSENSELIAELLRGMPESAFRRAQHAAAAIEKVFVGLAKDHPKDPAIALGAAFAIFKIAEGIVQRERNASESLIQIVGGA